MNWSFSRQLSGGLESKIKNPQKGRAIS